MAVAGFQAVGIPPGGLPGRGNSASVNIPMEL